MVAKQVEAVTRSPGTHWVGDGFPVASVFAPGGDPQRWSPFVLLDYAGPVEFAPARAPRGVGTHPHRGFETVTVVFQGELQHRDSAGNAGTIGAGDVQWMTAGAGVLHEEMHSDAFARTGGTLEMAQLWVNLPARAKSMRPRYQELRAAAIPVVELPDRAGTVRVIAGEFGGVAGAAATQSPVVLLDVRLAAGASLELPAEDGHTCLVYVRRGRAVVAGADAEAGRLVRCSRRGAGVALQVPAAERAELLVMGGQPIDEPFVAYGPFVMNTMAEIEQAIRDTRSGAMGRY